MAVNIQIQTIGDEKAIAAINNISDAEKEQKKSFEAANEEFKKSRAEMQKTSKEALNMKDVFASIKRAIVAAAIFDVFKQGITEIPKTTAAFQKLEATLTTALGSKSKAQEALRQIREFAAVTPFGVEEIGESFNKLANRIEGIKFDNNQFTALGDLSAALGKDLEVLIEAILDVNNTERWNELGIKVRTEGDKISGTFKGVTKTFERSEEGALAMAQAFGQMEGVAGGMALQAETLGGQYSNLVDNAQRLSLIMGEKLNGVFSETIQLFNNLVNAASDYLETPLSQKISEEQSELNVLATALINTADSQGNLNLENGTTAGLIAELNEKYPAFLSNLDQENFNINQVTSALKAANQEYVKKILLQQQEEKLTEIAKKQVDLQKELIELEKAKVRVSKTTVSAGAGFGGSTITAGIGKSEISASIEKDLEKTKLQLKEAEKEFEDAISSQNSLYQKFNLTKEETNKADEKRSSTIDNNTKSVKDNTEAEKQRNEEKQKALAIEKVLLEISKSELNFELEKIKSSKSDLIPTKTNNLENEISIRTQLIEISRKEALLIAKLNEEKTLANQNAAKALEILRIEADERRKQIENVEPIESKRVDIEKIVGDKITDLKKLNVEKQKAIIDEILDYQKKADDEELENEKRKAAQKQQIAKASFDIFVSLIDLDFTNKQNKLNAELDSIDSAKQAELEKYGSNEKAKELIEKRVEKKRVEIKIKQAEQERRKALFDVAIATATNAVKLFAQTVPPGILSAFAIAQGIIQAIAIKNQPLPKFFSGIDRLPLAGNPSGIDTIPALLNEGERIVPTSINNQLIGIKNADLPRLVALGKLFEKSSSSNTDIATLVADAVASAIKKQPKYISEWNENGVKQYIVKENSKVENLNKTFKL